MLSDIKPVPNNPDGILRVILIGRLSKAKETNADTHETIESSLAVAEKYLHQFHNGPTVLRPLAEQISGMVADRMTILEAMELIATGEWDLVMTEELSRISRNPRFQYIFVQDCVDAGIRFISVADNLDTADPNWEIMMAAGTLRHGMQVPDTRRRVLRKAEFSFHNGGMVMKVKFGHRKLSKDEARSGQFGPVNLRIAKVSECSGVFYEIRHRALQGRCAQAIVDWLIAEKIPPGPYVLGNWTVAILKSAMCDPIVYTAGGYSVGRNMCECIVAANSSERKTPLRNASLYRSWPI